MSTYSLVGYLSAINQPLLVLTLWQLESDNKEMYNYFVKHDVVPDKRIPIASSIPLTDRQIVTIPSYNKNFYVNLY
jgi:hypothetical protein